MYFFKVPVPLNTIDVSFSSSVGTNIERQIIKKDKHVSGKMNKRF